jgi:hemerythrin-like domain-containing protein
MRSNHAGRVLGALGAAALGMFAVLAVGRAKRAAAKAVVVLHGDWEGQLKTEHRAVKRMLKAMVETEIGDAAKRSALLAELADALTRHAVEEENVVYPALRGLGAVEEVHALLQDHADMKTMIRQLEEAGPEDPAWEDRARSLKRLVERHIRVEEKDAFPRLHTDPEPGTNEKITRLVRREGAKVTA